MKRTGILYLVFLILLCSCGDKSNTTKRTTPSFDDVLAQADHLNDSGFKDEALALVQKAHKAATDLTIGDEMKYTTYCNIAYGNRKDYDGSIRILDSMLYILEQAHQNTEIAKMQTVVNNAKADALFAKGLYNEAYDHYYKAQRLAKDHADSCSLRSYSYSLAMVLYKQQKYAQAAHQFIEAYNESLSCEDNFNLFYFKQEVLDNTGLCYSALHQYDSAMTYYNKALDYLENGAERYGKKSNSVYEAPKAVVYGNMAEVYLNMGKQDTAKMLFSKSIAINLQKGYANSDALVDQAKLAELYFNTGDITNARKTLDEIKAELDSIPDRRVEIMWNKLMWRYEELNHDSIAAHRYLHNYVLQNEANIAANKALMATDLDAKVKDIEKQYKIDLLTKGKSQQKIYLIIVTIVALMAISIIMLVWRDADKSHKNIAQLTQLNNTINEQNGKLEAAFEELVIKEKDKTRILRSVAHDVMNPIAAILSLTSILSYDEGRLTEDQLEILNLIKEACNNSLKLSKDILEAAVELDKSNISKEVVDINLLVARSVELLNFKAIEKKQHITVNADEKITAVVYKDKIWRVLNNLISNAIKFSHNDSDIKIHLYTREEKVHISVADNGVGIPDKNKPFVFDMFTEAKSPGTSGEVPHGLGLSISLQIAKAHDGNIWFESKEGKGSVFHLEFPAHPAF